MKTVKKLFLAVMIVCLAFAFANIAFADEAGYAEYLHEWLLAEDEVNDTMTSDIVENEFMPLIEAGDYETFPAEMLWGDMLVNGNPLTYEEWSAQNADAAAPAGDASEEPAASEKPAASEEPAAESEASFDINLTINGTEVTLASVAYTQVGEGYEFQLGNLLDVLGLELSYDEETKVATVMPVGEESVLSLVGAALEKGRGDEALAPVVELAEASEEPVAEEPAVEEAPVEVAAEESDVPATDGTENQSNVLDSDAQPASAEEFDAYVAYLNEYMVSYSGSGDGTFDDSARDMALGELSGVSFGADVNAFPFEMFVTQFGAKDFASYIAG